MKLASALCATMMSTSLMLASAPCLADPSVRGGPLPPGKPAGTRAAQGFDDTTLYIISGVVILGLIIGIAAGTGSSAPSTNTIAAAP